MHSINLLKFISNPEFWKIRQSGWGLHSYTYFTNRPLVYTNTPTNEANYTCKRNENQWDPTLFNMQSKQNTQKMSFGIGLPISEVLGWQIFLALFPGHFAAANFAGLPPTVVDLVIVVRAWTGWASGQRAGGWRPLDAPGPSGPWTPPDVETLINTMCYHRI